MEPVTEQMRRWRIGEVVRSDVQRSWVQAVEAMDQELQQLREIVASMPKPEPKRGRA